MCYKPQSHPVALELVFLCYFQTYCPTVSSCQNTLGDSTCISFSPKLFLQWVLYYEGHCHVNNSCEFFSGSLWKRFCHPKNLRVFTLNKTWNRRLWGLVMPFGAPVWFMWSQTGLKDNKCVLSAPLPSQLWLHPPRLLHLQLVPSFIPGGILTICAEGGWTEAFNTKRLNRNMKRWKI